MDRHLEGMRALHAQNQTLKSMMPSQNAFCLHHGRLEYVSIDPTQDFVFKCTNCIEIGTKMMIPINLILSSDDKTIFKNFPITDRTLVEELSTLVSTSPESEQLVANIVGFFKDFSSTLNHKLRIIEEKLIEKAKSSLNIDPILEKYNKISLKKELKEILQDGSKDFPAKSKEIKAICNKILSNETENNSSIREAFDKLKASQSGVDFQVLLRIKDEIFFSVEKMDIFQENHPNDKNENSIQKLMKLVNNKFNGISPESSQRLEEQLNRNRFAFSQIEVPEVGILRESLESLNADSLGIVKKLVEGLAKNHAANSIENKTKDREKLVAGDLVKLISNKANFCSKEYLKDVTNVLHTFEKVLGQFSVRKPRIKTKESNAFNNLNEKQLLNLTKLAIKMKQITEQHSDSYVNSLTPHAQFQSNSHLIRTLIGQPKRINFQENSTNISLSESLNRILVSYPIFELLPVISNKLLMLPIPLSFVKTYYRDSQEIKITQKSGSLQLSLDPSKCGQVVSDILDNKLGYLVKLKFNKAISGTSNQFKIGLIPNSDIHSKFVLSQSLSSGFVTYAGQGASVILKGGKLTSKQLRETIDSIEIRFCVSKQLFVYADPSYSNVNQILSHHIEPTIQYRFGVYFDDGYSRPHNMLVEISEFGTIDPLEVTHFEQELQESQQGDGFDEQIESVEQQTEGSQLQGEVVDQQDDGGDQVDESTIAKILKKMCIFLR